MWRGQPPSRWLSLSAFLIALAMMMPVAYVLVRALSADAQKWTRLLDERIPVLLWNTVSLAAVVALCAGSIGVILAWLVYRTDLPFRRQWRWMLALPLAVPPYVGAMAYVIVFGPRGWAYDVFGSSPIDMYSFAGAAFVLTAFTYPYVFLITGAALSRMGRAHEEVARSLGLGQLTLLRRVTLPMVRPALGAGIVLVVLYVISDFGAVAMLRFTTFTAAIYYQMGGFDTESAAILSTVLIALTVAVLFIESRSRARQRFYQSGGVPGAPQVIQLGTMRWAALTFAALVLIASFLLPIGVMAYWARVGIAQGELGAEFVQYALNTLQVAGIAAVAGMVLAIPVAYLRSRHPAPASAVAERLAYSGYALPGVIVALGMIFFALRVFPAIYNTMFVLALAYVVRFMPQAMQSTGASLAQISPRIDDAARIAGLGPFGVMSKVISRLARPGILAGGALVFVSSAKELPATLLLRPVGFDTLAVRVWVEAAESQYYLAAPAALLLVLISALPLKWMIDRY